MKVQICKKGSTIIAVCALDDELLAAVQECDATMFNTYSQARFTKI
jgi:hypothetical protein